LIFDTDLIHWYVVQQHLQKHDFETISLPKTSTKGMEERFVLFLSNCRWTEAAKRHHSNSVNAVVTCEMKFQNYFSLCQRGSEIILFQHMETCLKLFQNYFTGSLQRMNIFQHVHCRW